MPVKPVWADAVKSEDTWTHHVLKFKRRAAEKAAAIEQSLRAADGSHARNSPLS